MGHYRSEMGYEDEDDRRAREKSERLQARAKELELFIKEYGIAYTLARMLDYPDGVGDLRMTINGRQYHRERKEREMENANT